jgi:hypothetical protein
MQQALCKALPNDCIWFSPQLGASALQQPPRAEDGDGDGSSTLAGTGWRQVMQGVSDYRLLVSIRDPIKWLVSSYLFYGLRGQVIRRPAERARAQPH